MRKLLINIHILFYKNCPRRGLIEQDVDHWKEVYHWQEGYVQVIKRLLLEREEFRNLFYYRLGYAKGFLPLLKLIAPPLVTLYIRTHEIGGGLFIQHGFATTIGGLKIGRHCSVNQQVTIGYNGDKSSVIGDNVLVTCGAKILGAVVGNNVKIGANAVVVKDVPDDVTIVGVPAYIIKRNGVKVYEKL